MRGDKKSRFVKTGSEILESTPLIQCTAPFAVLVVAVVTLGSIPITLLVTSVVFLARLVLLVTGILILLWPVLVASVVLLIL